MMTSSTKAALRAELPWLVQNGTSRTVVPTRYQDVNLLSGSQHDDLLKEGCIQCGALLTCARMVYDAS